MDDYYVDDDSYLSDEFDDAAPQKLGSAAPTVSKKSTDAEINDESDHEKDLSESEDAEKNEDPTMDVLDMEEEYEDEIDYKKVSNHIKKIVIIDPDNRRMSHIMTRYEMTEYVSSRLKQISLYDNCFAPKGDLTDPASMAKRELMMRLSPLNIRRYAGTVSKNGELIDYYEDWSPNEMQFAISYPEVL